MANFYCEPAWHIGGAKFPADFLILQLPEARTISSASFACCERHAGRALKQMTEHGEQVTVHRVHNEDAASTR